MHPSTTIVAALVAATTVFGPSRSWGQDQLAFLTLTPGASRTALEATLEGWSGQWHCAVSLVDDRFTECRGSVTPAGEPRFDLTASLVHDSLAVLLLATTASAADLTRWVTALTGAYGPPALRNQQGLVTRQWVRARRMIRVTSRMTAGNQAVSVSLVDGVLLDGLGATSSGPVSSSRPASSPGPSGPQASSPPPSSRRGLPP